MRMGDRGSQAGRPEHIAARRLLFWIAPLCILACTAIACATTVATGTARHINIPTVAAATDVPVTAVPATSPISPTAIVPTTIAPTNSLVLNQETSSIMDR